MLPLLPSQRLAGLVAVAALAFLVSTELALLLNGTLLTLLLAEAVLLLRLPVPDVSRTTPPRVALGGDAEVKLEFTTGEPARTRNRSPRRIVWTDDLGPGIERTGPRTLETVLPGRGGALGAASYRIRGVGRGRARFGDIHLRVLGPLGLLWRQARRTASDALQVQPGLLELRAHRVLSLHHRREIGSHRLQQVGEGREFARLREYARGDDPRRIDWKASARHGEPIVREYEAERSQSVLLAIDAGRLMIERFDGRERLDHALAAALVLADAAAVHGDSVGVLVFADRVQAFVPPARLPLSRIADMLAAVEARPVEPDYPGAFRYLGRQLRRRSLVVLFSDVVDPRTSRALLAHLVSSARRHLPLLVAIRNVELEAAAQAPASREAEAYRRAAAEELLQEREVALGEVRRQGVLVADVRPDDVVTGAMASYLEVKRRGRL